MNSTLKIKFFFFTFLVFLNYSLQAQTFGFGCLGLSGFYGGYSIQQYTLDGINNYIKIHFFGPQPTSNIEFKEAAGYRIGANLFRAKFDDFFISAKGFYQFMNKVKEQGESSISGIVKNKYTFSVNHWGLAIDFGIPLFSFIDFKLVEGGIIFYDMEFTHEALQSNTQVFEYKFKPEQNKFTYYVGTGLIFHLIPDYVSVEGTASYSFLKIDSIVRSDTYSSIGPTTIYETVKKSGIQYTIQLNVGFPL